MSQKSRFWTNCLHDSLIKAALISGQNKLQLKKENIVEQIFIISRFVLAERLLFTMASDSGNFKGTLSYRCIKP
jgi:hypothetical protein